jgi:hypothetical protein
MGARWSACCTTWSLALQADRLLVLQDRGQVQHRRRPPPMLRPMHALEAVFERHAHPHRPTGGPLGRACAQRAMSTVPAQGSEPSAQP